MYLLILPILLTVVIGLRTTVTAQQPPAYPLSLPSCAQPALDKALHAAGCAQGDQHCICSKHILLSRFLAETSQICSKKDGEAVQSFENTYCGVSNTTTAPAPIGTTTKAYGGLPSVVHSTQATEPSLEFNGSGSATGVPFESTTTDTRNGDHSATPTVSTDTHKGGAVETDVGAAAMGVAVGAMGWAFAEL